MAEKAKLYNNFSPKLRSYLPKLKPGEKIRFQLTGIHYDKITKKLICPASVKLPKIDRIYDPWARPGEKKGEYEGEYIDIAYILHEAPAPNSSPRDTLVEFGRIEFTRHTAGIIEIVGGNMELEKMLPYLFFFNRNKTNVGKPWYVKSSGKHVFAQLEVDKQATKELENQRRIDKAKAMIDEFTEEELQTAAAGLLPGKYHVLTKDEIIIQLRNLAERDVNKIMDLSTNVEVKTTAFVEELLKNHLIEIDRPKNRVVYADDKQPLCFIKPNQTPHSSLKHYFMTDEGMEAVVVLEKQLELVKKSQKDKTEKAVV